jgi:RNA polymerase sigma factor (sigma-70 family)
MPIDINRIHADWAASPTPENYEALGKALLWYLTQQLHIKYGAEYAQYEDADAIGRAILDILKDLPKFKGESLFSTWCEAILQNQCHDIELERDERREVTLDPAIRLPAKSDLYSREEKLTLKQLIAKHLTPSQKVLVKLKMTGYTEEEIGERLNIHANTVTNRWMAIEAILKKAANT